MAIMNGNKTTILSLKNLYSSNILKLYSILEELNELNELNDKPNIYIEKYIDEYKKHKSVEKYLNKIRIFKNLNNYKNCNYCLDENVLNIIFECGHEICSKCYVQLNSKCYFNFCNE